MNPKLLHTDVQKYIRSSLDADIPKLLLQKQQFEGISQQELVEQIISKGKCGQKLPMWFGTPQIYYPNKLNIEQTSSEISAAYKAQLVQGNRLLDCTGGLGVDSLYFAQHMGAVTHCELSPKLAQIAEHNFEVLGVTNIHCVTANGLDYLESGNEQFDWIFIDPSRRSDAKGKVFLLADCLPNVPAALPLLWEHTDQIMIKTSPILDLTAGLGELPHVQEIHIVGVRNEVKELLWILKKDYTGPVTVHTVDIHPSHTHSFSFAQEDAQRAEAHYGPPKKYLYEPHTALMKSGAFALVSPKFSVDKLHPHTHLFTADVLVDFPGRRFEIKAVLPYHKKALKNLGITKANITTRNFPERVDQIRKKLRIADGGDTYLFFCTDMEEERLILVCAKITDSPK